MPLLLELRIDRFPQIQEERLAERVHAFRKLGLPLIATIRSKREGGARSLSDQDRFWLFKKVLSAVNAVDLELSSPFLVRRLTPLARSQGKRVILSHHDFRKTPSDRTLQKLFEKGRRAGADIVKIAVTPKRSKEVARLLLFAQRNRGKHLITIAMGKRGIPSRVLGPLFGSLLTYGSLGRPQAPGQLALSKLLNELKPFLGHR